MGIQVQRTKSEPIPAGAYMATIENVEEAEGKFGPQLKAKFVIDEEGFEGKALTGWASLTFSPKSKLFGWVRAAVFNGRDVPENYQTFDADHLIGRRVLLSVTTERGTDGDTYNRVRDVLPYRVAKAQPPANARPPAVTARVASAAPAQPGEAPDWPEWDEMILSDPGPTDEDEA
jgi:hypothetical protein